MTNRDRFVRQQDLMLIALASMSNTIVPSWILIQAGWSTPIAIWAIIGSTGCIYAANKLLRQP